MKGENDRKPYVRNVAMALERVVVSGRFCG